MKKQEDILQQYDFIDVDYMFKHISKYEKLVGRYIILFSYLEHNINLLIANILNERSDEIGYIVTTKMSMSDKINLLDRFTKLDGQGEFSTIKKVHSFIPHLKELNAFRNIIAHANWASMKKTGMVRVKIKVDESTGIWFENKKITKDEIKEKCGKLIDLNNALEETIL